MMYDYHCEGPASGAGTVGAAGAAASGTFSLPPPPAESTGCVAHGDHYDCTGPASGHGASESGTGHDHDHDDDHDHDPSGSVAAVTGSLPPPPTESVGCVVHGDHYHCEGPASRTLVGTASSRASAAAITSVAAVSASRTALASSVSSAGAASV